MNTSSDRVQETEDRNRVQTQNVFHEIGCLSRAELLARYQTLAWGYINQSETDAVEHAFALIAARRDPAPILDVGCGTGRLLVPLSRRYKAVGLDFSRSFLEQLKAEHPAIPTHYGNATELPFGEGEFGSIMCVRLIQHLTAAEQDRFAQECRRVLRPGGSLVLLNYNALSFLTLYKKLCQSRLGRAWGRWPLKRWNWEVDDYHFAGELAALCRRNGFKIVSQFACTPGEPDLDRFLGLDKFLGRHCPGVQALWYRLLMRLNGLGRTAPFCWLFSRVIVVAERE